VLLDFGVWIPIHNQSWAQNYNIPTYTLATQRLVETFGGKIEPEIRLTYTYPVRRQHSKHFF
jgi:hypothetical protein